MAQHDYNIANQTASSARTDINNAFAAIQSTNSGVAAPTTTVGNMIWYDTANNILQIRNEGNTAWITLGTVDQGNSTFEPNQTIATQAEAEAGVQATKLMTAVRVKQSITANAPVPDYSAGNAALSQGAVGTYVFAGSGNYVGTYSFGSTYAGSSLIVGGIVAANAFTYNTALDQSGSTSLSGTWRAMGFTGSHGLVGATVFLRIS
jgi:hypothetical protein